MVQNFEIVIMGAGPAGLTAAIRLLEMGHAVALIEQEQFPRPQIGESLSPGVRHIFDYLGAGKLLEDARYLHDIPVRIAWNKGEPVLLEAGQRGAGLMVDRAHLDAQMLALAIRMGLYIFQPARMVASSFRDDRYELRIQSAAGDLTITGNVVLDGRGRNGAHSRERVELAPASVGIWTHVASHAMPPAARPHEARIETVQQGWIWGAPVPGNRYRVMAFTDADLIKEKGPAKSLQLMLSQARLFSTPQTGRELDIKSCVVNAYVHTTPWHQQFIKIGEAAFTLDPLSSTGVEAAMRFSLQTAVAVHTMLSDGDPAVARAFYESKLADAVASHCRWTSGYYAQSAQSEAPSSFWEKRKNFRIDEIAVPNAFIGIVKQRASLEAPVHRVAEAPAVPIEPLIGFLWNKPVRLSSRLTYSTEFAVTGDRVETRQALVHPNLPRPTVYVNHIELPPLLHALPEGVTYGAAIENWCRHFAYADIKKIFGFLWAAEVFE